MQTTDKMSNLFKNILQIGRIINIFNVKRKQNLTCPAIKYNVLPNCELWQDIMSGKALNLFACNVIKAALFSGFINLDIHEKKVQLYVADQGDG